MEVSYNEFCLQAGTLVNLVLTKRVFCCIIIYVFFGLDNKLGQNAPYFPDDFLSV